MSQRPLIDYVVEAFEKLGRRAHLKLVYQKVQELGYEGGGEDLPKLIRKRIYEHSSDSPQFIASYPDLFRQIGEERSGVWGLRGKAPVRSKPAAKSAPVLADPFREYKSKEPVPEGLREAFTGFVRSARGGRVLAYLLPHGVKTTRRPRPKDSRDRGEDINEDFIKKGFSALVRDVLKVGDDCYVIRTNSSSIGFVQTISGAWKVYRYVDMPME
jgi:hypothetical protein